MSPGDAADALARATRRLAAAGIETAAGDAARLLEHAAGVPRGQLRLVLPDRVDAGALARFEEMVQRRSERVPVSHLTGRRAFWRGEFLVTPDVLDPRPETETLVALALEAPFERVLDLGTGSGCILLSLLAERPRAQGIGVDLSEAACAVARRNAEAQGLSGRAEIRQGDWFGPVTGRFDLVVSNPPYIAADEMPGLAPEVLREPRSALTDEGDGLGAYRRILAEAGAVLVPGGRLLFEIGAGQGEAVATLCRAAGLAEVAVRADLDGRDRVVTARAPG